MDSEQHAEIVALLARSWPRLPACMATATTWGAHWFERSTPFVRRVDGRLVAHVGVWPIELVLGGEARTVAGVHAVCSSPDARRRGHVRETLERALAWIDARYETAILWANDPAIYTRFGFGAVEESIFVAPLVPSSSPGPGPRLLSLARPPDLALVRELLARRAPVSTQTGVVEPGALALIDLALWRQPPTLAHLPGLDCVAVYGVRERFLDLYELIGPRIPTLDQLAGALELGPRVDTAVVYFTPDQLDAVAVRAEPTVLADTLMVRGAWPSTLGPIAFSPISRC